MPYLKLEKRSNWLETFPSASEIENHHLILEILNRIGWSLKGAVWGQSKRSERVKLDGTKS